MGKVLGGAGIGQRNSLAEYLGAQLASRIDRDGRTFPVERAYLCNDEIREVCFAGPDGNDLISSLTGSGYHLSIFRWRGPVRDA